MTTISLSTFYHCSTIQRLPVKLRTINNYTYHFELIFSKTPLSSAPWNQNGMLNLFTTWKRITVSDFFEFLWFSKKMLVGFQPWTFWSFLWTDISLVGPSIINMSLFWKHRIVLYLKGGVSRESFMHHCVQFSKTIVVGFQPWLCWSFSWTDIALVALYITNMSRFWLTLECDIFELSSHERFKSFMHHWVQPSRMKVLAGFEPYTAQ